MKLFFAAILVITLIFDWYWLAGIALIGLLGYLFRSKSISIKGVSSGTFQPQDKLKKAVKLKKTNMDGAISLLREAYADGEALSMQEFLRLPKYLILNNQFDEAYKECEKLAHGYTGYESYPIGTWQWFYDQIDILKIQSQICLDEKKYMDAIYCNTNSLEYYIKAEEARQQTKKQLSLAKSNLDRIKNDSSYQKDIVLGKVFKKMGIEYAEPEAKQAINDWIKGWPSDSETLGSHIRIIAEKATPNKEI